MQVVVRRRSTAVVARVLVALLVFVVAGAVAPVVVEPAAAAPLPATWCGSDDGIADRPDVLGGNQIHVVYAVPSDQPDRFVQMARLIARDLAGVDTWWRSQDPTRTPRFDMMDAPGCATEFGALDITHLRLQAPLAALDPAAGDQGPKVASELALLLPDRAKKLLVYLDAPGPPEICGQAQSVATSGGPSFPVLLFLQSQIGCQVGGGYGAGTGWPALTAAHELVHSLNVTPSAHVMPHACPDDLGHACDSSRDIIAGTSLNPSSLARVLDAGNDDYYGHSGDWWDVRDSRWLTVLDAAPVHLAVAIDGEEGGRVVSSLPGIACPGRCAVPWNPGASVELSAHPAPGFRFGGWIGACESTLSIPSCTPPALQHDMQITARFVPVVSLEVVIRGKGDVRTVAAGRAQACGATCSFTADLGERITLRARPSRRAAFSRWRDACHADRPRCRLTLNRERRVVAVFSRGER